jgi:chemotaxis protein methyltransferase CheR
VTPVASQSGNLGLSPAAVPLLRDLIHERTGLYYDAGRQDTLADRLAPLVVERGFASFLDYYYLLKYDADATDEWPRVMDALAVPETYFWRESDQLRAIVGIVVPELVRAHPGVPVRIWSVPCSTGEEPLTIAMMLHQAGWFDRAAIEIYASDASQAAIARARAGRFRERSFRNLPLHLRQRYFTQDRDTWVIDPEIHARVTSWSVVNVLCEGDVARHGRVPIVFCRNLFIYFSQAGVRQVVSQLARLMPSPGYLCVGASESLLRVTTAFDLEEIGGAFVYVKRGVKRETDA